MWGSLLYFLIISIWGVVHSKYEGAKVLRIYPKVQEHLHMLNELRERQELNSDHEEAISFWRYPRTIDSSADLLVPSKHLLIVEHLLDEADIPKEVLIDDVKEAIDQEQHLIQKRDDTDGFYSSYHSYKAIEGRLQTLKEKYPDILQTEVIGTTEEKRDLVLAKAKIDNGNTDKKVYFIEAGAHAREWISPATALYLLENVLENQDILEDSDVYVLPVFNPDGYEYSRNHDRMWRKNRSVNKHSDCRGTDLNRNFDVHWESGSQTPCRETFAGRSVQSEPEVKALVKSLKQLNRLDLYLCLHSYGQLWFYPWAYKNESPSNSGKMKNIAEKAVDSLKKKRGVSYKHGRPGSLIYSAPGSSLDWSHREIVSKNAEGVSYAIELRPTGSMGFLLPSSEIKHTAEDMVEGLKCIHHLLTKGGDTCDY